MGIAAAKAGKARDAITAAAFAHDFSFTHVSKRESAEMYAAVQELVGSGQYFQAFLPDGSRLVHPINRCAAPGCCRVRLPLLWCVAPAGAWGVWFLSDCCFVQRKETQMVSTLVHERCPSTRRAWCRNVRHPISFGREVLAQLANVPDRADWRKCKLPGAADEEQAALAFQKMYMPFMSA